MLYTEIQTLILWLENITIQNAMYLIYIYLPIFVIKYFFFNVSTRICQTKLVKVPINEREKDWKWKYKMARPFLHKSKTTSDYLFYIYFTDSIQPYNLTKPPLQIYLTTIRIKRTLSITSYCLLLFYITIKSNKHHCWLGYILPDISIV